jgi:drug/metabolite transporter (DMT)-like permease
MSAQENDDAAFRLTLAGIGLSILAYFLFSVHDALIKLLVADTSVWQILAIRSAVILATCLVIGRRQIVVRLVESRVKGWLITRGVVLLGAWLCFYTAARDLQLGELTTLYFAAPVIVTALAGPLLGETVTRWRWFAVLVGFVGVVTATNPVNLGLSVPVVLALVAACLWAGAFILSRKIAAHETTLVQMIFSNTLFLVVTAIGATFVWQSPDWSHLALNLGIGVCGGLAQFTLLEGIRRASAAVLAPYEYIALIWAFLLGYAIWGDVPRSEVVVGAALIAIAGLLLIYGERRRPIRAS